MTAETPGPARDESTGDERADDTLRGTGDERADAKLRGTGDERVDATLRRLAEINGLPLDDQVGRYREVHDALQDILADAEQD